MADPQLKLTWWDKARPKTLPSTGYGKVLSMYEKALKDFERVVSQPKSAGPDVDKAYQAVRKALGGVSQGAQATVKKCNKTLHKDAIALLATVEKKTVPTELKRLDGLYTHWSNNKAGLRDKMLAELKKVYDARESVVQGLVKVKDAPKEADAINDELNELMTEHGRLMRTIKAAPDAPAAKKAADVFKGSAGALQRRADAWLKKVDPALQAKWPPLELKAVPDTEKSKFSKQSDQRDNLMNVFKEARGKVAAAGWLDKALKEVQGALK